MCESPEGLVCVLPSGDKAVRACEDCSRGLPLSGEGALGSLMHWLQVRFSLQFLVFVACSLDDNVCLA